MVNEMVFMIALFFVGFVCGIVLEKLSRHESKEFDKFQDRWNACKMGNFDNEEVSK